ncbi:hypothetical protein BGX29_010325 [Mortierella sp. GBA35]|nr:hypothetical protein BGX29_010325 [Mortierella sp. GBA35]
MSSNSSSCNIERGGGERTTYAVPDDLILAQSDHIRILTNDHRCLFGRRTFECPHLIDLTIYGDSSGLVRLVRSHPGLKRLTWYGNVPYSGMLSDLEVDCFSELRALQSLTLSQWDISTRQLPRAQHEEEGEGCQGSDVEEERGRGLIEVLAKACSKTLRRLTLRHIQGLDDLPSLSNTTDHDHDDLAGASDGVVLDQLEELVVDGEWIEKLHLGAGLLEDPEMIARLEGMLPLAHPGPVRDITIIDSRPWAQYRQIGTPVV